MRATHTTLTTNDRIHGTTPTGRILRTGTYQGFQDRTNTPTGAREYEAIVRWDGDDHDSPVSFDRLTPTADPAPTAREEATLTAARAARTYQADPTTDAFTHMLATIDRATELGASNDDIIAALAH